MTEQFRHEATSNAAGHYHLITCTLCGWRIGTCGSYIGDLQPRRQQHAELCRMPDSKPEPCGQPNCIKCHP